MKTGILRHLLKLDHFTFLIALVLIVINIFVGRTLLDLLAFLILLFALLYDIYEFYSESSG